MLRNGHEFKKSDMVISPEERLEIERQREIQKKTDRLIEMVKDGRLDAERTLKALERIVELPEGDKARAIIWEGLFRMQYLNEE